MTDDPYPSLIARGQRDRGLLHCFVNARNSVSNSLEGKIAL